MPGRSVRIARIAGIPVGISPWWLLVVALLTWSLSAGYFPESAPGLAPVAAVALALASVLVLFAGILAHEFAHALVARRAGVEIEEIDLWLLGGVARMRNQPRKAGDELRFALAGPALTAVLAVAFGLAVLALPQSAPTALDAFLEYQFQVNVAIAFFNLLPALPLDGGRAARALLWRRTGDLRRATVVAARAGRWIAYGMVYFGAFATLVGYLGGLWLAVIGLFLVAAATAERRQVEIEAALGGRTAGEVMTAPAIALPAELPLPRANNAMRQSGLTAAPIVDRDGVTLGVLAASRVATATAATAGDVADPEASLLLAPDEPVASLLERPAFLRLGRAVVVDAERRPLGVVSVRDLQCYLRAERVAGARPPRPEGAPR
jgi:Zn-dependent protease